MELNGKKVKMSVVIIGSLSIFAITLLILFNINSNYQANQLEINKCFDKGAGVSVVVENKFVISKTTVSCGDD